MTPQPNFFSFIPATVLNHKELSPSAKLFYCQITGLTNEKGFCWASNAYFAQRNEVSEWTISNWISQLQKHGFVRVEIDKVAGNQRRIYTADVTPLLRKTPIGYREKSHDPIGKNHMTLLGKTPTIVSKESKERLVSKGECNAHAENQNSVGLMAEKKEKNPPVAAPPLSTTTVFANSPWALAPFSEWQTSFLDRCGDLGPVDASYYLQRVTNWSAKKQSKSADWVGCAAEFARNDAKDQRLVTIQPFSSHANASSNNQSTAKPGAGGLKNPAATIARAARLTERLQRERDQFAQRPGGQ